MHAYRKKSMYAFPAEGHSEDQNNFNMTIFLFNNVIAYFFFFLKQIMSFQQPIIWNFI